MERFETKRRRGERALVKARAREEGLVNRDSEEAAALDIERVYPPWTVPVMRFFF